MASTIRPRISGTPSASATTGAVRGASSSLAMKAPCRALSTTNVTKSGEQTIGGVACVADDRVVLNGQTTGSENGVWVISTGAWKRAPDFDGARDVVRGTRVLVTSGTNAGLWEVSTANPITIGTTSIAFTEVAEAAGSTGATGATGPTGPAGPSPAPTFTYSTTTADADPGAGVFRLNNATIASATAAYVDNLDESGGTISGWLDTFDDSTSTVKGILVVKGVDTVTAFAVFSLSGSVVDGTGYRKLTLTHLASGGTFTDGESFALSFYRAGDKGDTGATGSTGNTGATGSGTQGEAGPPSSITMTWATSTSDSDNGDGYIAADNSDLTLAATLFVDNERYGGGSIDGWVDSWDDSLNVSSRGIVTLIAVADPTVFRMYKVTGLVTDGTGYRKVPVAHLDGNGTFDADDEVIVSFAPSGDRGSPGDAVDSVSAGLTAPMLNGYITASVAASALTVALKTLAGTDPTDADPVTFNFRSSSLTDGAIASVEVAAALSLTIPSTATMGASNGVAFDLLVVVFNDGGIVRLGLVNPLTTDTFDESALKSSTTVGTGADSAGVIYTGAGVTSKPYRVIGFLSWSGGLATAGTWNAAPTTIQSGVQGTGKPRRSSADGGTDYQAFTANGTWTKPANVTASSRVFVQTWAPGGGGGANATGGGGGGGAYVEGWFLASALGATETVTVPAGGAVNTAGGNATFGSWLTAYGGGAGANAAGGGGGGGGGALGAGVGGSAGNGGNGGEPGDGTSVTAAFGGGKGASGDTAAADSGTGGGGGANGTFAAAAGSSIYGGGGGGSPAGSAGTSKFGGNGGATGVAGSAPGGGGGRNAAGGRGEIRVTTFI